MKEKLLLLQAQPIEYPILGAKVTWILRARRTFLPRPVHAYSSPTGHASELLRLLPDRRRSRGVEFIGIRNPFGRVRAAASAEAWFLLGQTKPLPFSVCTTLAVRV